MNQPEKVNKLRRVAEAISYKDPELADLIHEAIEEIEEHECYQGYYIDEETFIADLMEIWEKYDLHEFIPGACCEKCNAIGHYLRHYVNSAIRNALEQEEKERQSEMPQEESDKEKEVK